MTDPKITAVAAWQARMGITDREAAKMLGMALTTYQGHKLGKLRGKKVLTKQHFLLACAALEAGLPPISEQKLNESKISENIA